MNSNIDLNNIESLRRASKEELDEFFSLAIFKGIYVNRVRSRKKPEAYSGSIERISYNGIPLETVSYINVPTSKSDIKFGKCVFQCSIHIPELRDNGHLILFLKDGSLQHDSVNLPREQFSGRYQSDTKKSYTIFSNDEKRLAEDWQLGASKRFIGLFEENSSKTGYIISDIRRPNDFTKIESKLTIEVESRYVDIPSPDKYYSFEWILLKYITVR